jgi:hypothetical protein
MTERPWRSEDPATAKRETQFMGPDETIVYEAISPTVTTNVMAEYPRGRRRSLSHQEIVTATVIQSTAGAAWRPIFRTLIALLIRLFRL